MIDIEVAEQTNAPMLKRLQDQRRLRQMSRTLRSPAAAGVVDGEGLE